MPTYTDEYIEKWANVFLKNRLSEHGIIFEIFLQFPQNILDAINERDFEPLLPQQAYVQKRLGIKDQLARERRAYMSVQLRGGHYIKPMHHHLRKKSQANLYRAGETK